MPMMCLLMTHRVYVSCGEGFIDVFALDRLSRINHIPTAIGARTGLYDPNMDRFFLAVKATHDIAAAMDVQTGGVLRQKEIITTLLIALILYSSLPSNSEPAETGSPACGETSSVPLGNLGTDKEQRAIVFEQAAACVRRRHSQCCDRAD